MPDALAIGPRLMRIRRASEENGICRAASAARLRWSEQLLATAGG